MQKNFDFKLTIAKGGEVCYTEVRESEKELAIMDEKKKALFIEQKKTLDIFLSKGAISKAQYDKSYGDLIKLMGMEDVAKELEGDRTV